MAIAETAKAAMVSNSHPRHQLRQHFNERNSHGKHRYPCRHPGSSGRQFPTQRPGGPSTTLVGKDLADVGLASLGGKRKVLQHIFPSIDTPTCALSVRKFNQHASQVANTVVLCISTDLPFAQNRFCSAEGLENVVTLSTLRGREFLENYGVLIADSGMAGLAARAVVVLDENNTRPA